MKSTFLQTTKPPSLLLSDEQPVKGFVTIDQELDKMYEGQDIPERIVDILAEDGIYIEDEE